MKSLFLVYFLSFSILACDEIPQELKPFTSQPYSMLCRSDYELAYSAHLKSALWSAEYLKPGEVSTSVRVNAFRADPDLLPDDRANLVDYVGSNYDRGHLAPADDMSSPKAMQESFYLSNMVPQSIQHNRGIWKSLEGKVRNQIASLGELIVFTGPIYGDKSETIGKNKLYVPEALFKVVYHKPSNTVITFIIPNSGQDSKHLEKFISTLATLEKETGISFFSNIPVRESASLWQGF